MASFAFPKLDAATLGAIETALEHPVSTPSTPSSLITVVGSQQIHPNSTYTVAVNLHEASNPCVLKVSIENGDNFKMSKEVLVQPFTTETVSFETGDMPPPTDNGYELIAEGVSGIMFRKESPIELNAKRSSTLIQTDKAMYKPGDKIQFRVILLDRHMRPLEQEDGLSVHILDGQSNRLQQWSNQAVPNGVFSSELQLSDSPVLGEWTIVVDVLGETKKKTIEVAEYVLPKVEVAIETRSDITFKDPVRAAIQAKYTYGQPVRGEAKITLSTDNWQSCINHEKMKVLKAVKLNGKEFVEFDLAELKISTTDYQMTLSLEAEVEEELTGRIYNATATITVRKSEYYVINVINTYEFVPGKPLFLKLRIVRHDGNPIPDTQRSIEVIVMENNKKHSSEMQTLDREGNCVFTTTLTKNSYSVTVNYLGQTEQAVYLYARQEAVRTILEAKAIPEKATLSAPVELEVSSPDPMTYFTYQLLAGGKVQKTATVKFDSPVSNHIIQFEPTREMMPTAKVVVYYLKDGAMVSSYCEVEIADPENKISLKSSVDEAKPSDDIDLIVDAQPGSFVGLLGIDQSVLLLKSGNDLSQSEINDEWNQYGQNFGNSSGGGAFRGGCFPPFRRAARDFSNAGAVLLSNLVEPHEEFRSCGPLRFKRQCGGGGVAFGAAAAVTTAEVTVRTVFPDTWIWDDISKIGSDGPFKLTKKVPDTITSWVISAFALNPRTGISLTQDPTKVRVFQPFFVSLNLPYSIKRGEIVTIPVIVFNYMSEDLTAEVTLHNVDQAFEFVSEGVEASATKHTQSIAVQASNGSVVSFTINPIKVGPITIKVTAVSPVAGDGVERILPVEPEGVPKYVNKAVFVDLRDTNEMDSEFVVEIPKGSVPDSARVEVSAIGDILGSTIKNLDSLIRMPYGCGEQNMLNFVPNIVIINYLKTTHQLNEALKTKALKYMQVGYQQELTYRHKDGSFSAFGDSDKSGSTWLTAFVARSFRQAAQHIDIEERIIDESLKWLSAVQTECGSFPEVGQVCHTDMQGGSGNGIALTAYTLIAFVENKAHIQTYHKTIEKAINYIVKNIDALNDIYAFALAAYALQLAGHGAKGAVLQTFDSKATVGENHKYWNKPIVEVEPKNCWYSRPSSVNTEMTAYGLLTLIESRPCAEVIPIMKWLLSQRNDQGGFESTQDTVVGLQALAKIAEKIATTESALDIKVKYGSNGESCIKVNKENSLIHQQYELPKDTENVKIHASGHGFALVQLSYKYHVAEKEDSPSFTITPKVESSPSPKMLKLNVSTSYVATSESIKSNMAVMEVEFPSGFTVDSDSIDDLKAYENVKKVETKNGDTTVIVYFDHIGSKELTPTFMAIRTHQVEKQKPAAVTVYDYYDTTRRANAFYSIDETTPING